MKKHACKSTLTQCSVCKVHSGAFTLMELLLTIAVLAILAGMLLSAVSKARAQGYKVSCLSNKKQIGYAAAAYNSEYKNYQVAARGYGTESTIPMLLRDGYGILIHFGYLGKKDDTSRYSNGKFIPVMRCTAMFLLKKDRSYALNYHYPKQWNESPSNKKFYSLNPLKHPSTVVQSAESSKLGGWDYNNAVIPNWLDNMNYVSFPHNENTAANWLFFDGHAETMLYSKIAVDPAKYMYKGE